jgi:hypothetical protein
MARHRVAQRLFQALALFLIVNLSGKSKGQANAKDDQLNPSFANRRTSVAGRHLLAGEPPTTENPTANVKQPSGSSLEALAF